MEPDPELNRITNAIIGAAIEVHRALGPGHLESAYEEAMDVEMALRGMRFRRQVGVVLMYKGREVGKAWLDFLVEDRVVLELKSVEQIAPVHIAQVILSEHDRAPPGPDHQLQRPRPPPRHPADSRAPASPVAPPPCLCVSVAPPVFVSPPLPKCPRSPNIASAPKTSEAADGSGPTTCARSGTGRA
jgi:GxxExxY protein